MDNVFEVDKTGRNIRLSKERWSHIISPGSSHPYMTNHLEEVRQTVVEPDIIVRQKFDHFKANYYKYVKERKEYLAVVIKYLNGEGFILTSFMTKKAKIR